MLYDHLSGSSIRLLNVIRVDGDGEVVCRLHSFNLSSTPTFDAVSYVWGPEGRTEAIVCNNEPLQVTPALKTMLQHIFHHRPDHLELEQTLGVSLRPLWIDAICIDQDNPQEIEAQIRLMGSFFARATRVVIWLGLEGRHTDSFMYGASTVVRALERRSLTCPFHWEQPAFSPLEHGIQSVWMGLQEILQKEWPSRLWTFQEAVLAKHAVVMCGRHSVDLNVVTKIDRLLENGPFDINSFMQEQRQNRAFPYIFPFKDIGLFRDLVTQDNSSSPKFGVPWLLSQGYRKGAKRPVDRIWSFLGLLEERLRAEIMPILTHDDQGWKTYMRLTKILLKYDTRFDLLSLSTHIPGNTTEKPSWCLELAAPMPYRTFYFMRDNYRAGISNQPQPTRWNCHSHQTRIPKVDDDDDKILEVPGFHLATVDRVIQEERLQQDRFHVSDPESVATWIDWEERCRALARQVHYGDTMHGNSDLPLPPNYLRVHASNMVADADCVYSDIGNDVITSLISSIREQYCGDSGGFDASNSSTSRVFTLISKCLHQIFREKRVSGKLQGLIGECYQAIERNIGRAFFSTREGKRLGLGPPYMKPGDVVCGFYNSGPLHILRFEETADEAGVKCAMYIGDAYVDGCMDLDELAEEMRGRDEVFCIQ